MTAEPAPENVRSLSTAYWDSIDLTAVERLVVAGDLAELSPKHRWSYYVNVCRSVGLNPATQPFQYLKLQNRLTLYATKGAAEQLRRLYGISIQKPEVRLEDGLCLVSVLATAPDGRTDSELGITAIEGLKGENRANAILKAITKAKRRVTLSMVGLGMLDETEVETIPGARYLEADDVHGQHDEPDADEQEEETTAERWARLVEEAELRHLKDAARYRAIDPSVVPEPQLAKWADQLADRLRSF